MITFAVLHIAVFLHADVDECVTGFHTCEQLCNNTLGSYTCSCEAGFMIKNGSSCIGELVL